MKRARFLIILLTIAAFSGCLNAQSSQILPNNEHFSVLLHQSFSGSEGAPRSFALSPLGAQLALELALLGTRGDAAMQIRTTLARDAADDEMRYEGLRQLATGLKAKKADGSTIRLATRLFAGPAVTIKPGFQELARNALGAEAQNVQFGTRRAESEMNAWLTGATGGKITKLANRGSFGKETRLVLASGLYFKGRWETPFNPEQTARKTFTREDGTKARLSTMRLTAPLRYVVSEGLNATLVELPYKGSSLRMVLALPAKSMPVAELEKRFTETEMPFTELFTEMTEQSIKLAVPKFSLKMAVNLEKPLQAMGVREMFGDTADLSGLAESAEKLRVDRLMQKIYFTFTEGTQNEEEEDEYAEATKAPNEISLKFNRPFLAFLIYGQGKEPLQVLLSARYGGSNSEPTST